MKSVIIWYSAKNQIFIALSRNYVRRRQYMPSMDMCPTISTNSLQNIATVLVVNNSYTFILWHTQISQHSRSLCCYPLAHHWLLLADLPGVYNNKHSKHNVIKLEHNTGKSTVMTNYWWITLIVLPLISNTVSISEAIQHHIRW